MNETARALLQVIEVLETLEVPYFIGGSLASTVYGHVRTTLDADVVALLGSGHVAPFVAALVSEFYADEQKIREAVLHSGSFNLIHLETMFKVDIFIPTARPFVQSQFERRSRQIIDNTGRREAYLASAEDIVLAKLEWYEQGNRVSIRQWEDVLGVLRVQGERLDLAYLLHWAERLGVSELLDQARREAGIPE